MNITDTGQIKLRDVSEVGITDGLIGYWKLDGDVKDYSGNNNNGLIIGDVTTTSGLKTSAYNFNGTSSYIKLTNPLSQTQKELSISVWVKPSGTQNEYSGILGNHDGYTGFAIQQMSTTLNLYSFIYGDGTSWGSWTSDTSQLTTGVWQLLTITKSNTEVKSYINGYLNDTTSATSSIIPFSGDFFIGLGYNINSRLYTGGISNVKIFNRTLSKEETLIEYKFGLTNTGMQLTKDGTLYLNNFINEAV